MKYFFTFLAILISVSVFARKIEINNTVTSTGPNGPCEWKITGWVDVSVTWGWPPIVVNSYDITMDGPCGNYHFNGIVSNENNNPVIEEGELTDREMQPVDFESFLQIYQIIVALDEEYDE